MAEKTAPGVGLLGKKKELVVPSRKTMNFVHHQSPINLKRLIPVLVVLIAIAAVLGKVGLYDQIAKKTAAYSELSDRQMQLAALTARLADYDAVEKEYGRFSYAFMTDSEVASVDRMQTFELIESVIMTNAVVENLAINDNTLTLNIHGLTLNQATEMVKQLEDSPLVETATIYNASADNGKDAVIFMTVQLMKEVVEE